MTDRAPTMRLLPYQRRWVEDPAPLRVWEKSRRVGGTCAVAFDVVWSRLNGTRPRDYWFSSADESAAREFIDECKMWCGVFNAAVEFVTGEDVIDGRSYTVFTIQFPKCANGHAPKVVAMTSNPKRFRSKGGDVGLDEFAFHEDAEGMLKAASPVTTWGGRIDVLSTHNGENTKFNELVRMGQRRADPETHGAPKPDDLIVSLHRTTIHEAIESGLVEKINAVAGTAYTRESFLAELRTKTPKRDFPEEYECVPSSEESAFFPYADLRPLVRESDPVSTDNLGRFLDDIRAAVERIKPACLFAGCDVGRRHDRFVLTVGALQGERTLRRCGSLVYKDQKYGAMKVAIDALFLLSRDLVPVRRLCIDATGLGDNLCEAVQDSHGSVTVERVVFTNTVKQEMAGDVKVRVDERTMTIPNDSALLADYASIRRTITAANNIRFDAEANETGHADRFWADALMVHACGREPSDAFGVDIEIDGVLA